MAMVQGNYEVNVARLTADYGVSIFRHFCKIELGPLLPNEATEKWKELCVRFPVSEGYKLVLYKIECSGNKLASTH